MSDTEKKEKTIEEVSRIFDNMTEEYNRDLAEFSQVILKQEKQIKALKTEIKAIRSQKWIDQHQQGDHQEPTEKDMPFVTFDGTSYELWEDSDWFQELTEKERLQRRFWKPIK